MGTSYLILHYCKCCNIYRKQYEWCWNLSKKVGTQDTVINEKQHFSHQCLKKKTNIKVILSSENTAFIKRFGVCLGGVFFLNTHVYLIIVADLRTSKTSVLRLFVLLLYQWKRYNEDRKKAICSECMKEIQ